MGPSLFYSPGGRSGLPSFGAENLLTHPSVLPRDFPRRRDDPSLGPAQLIGDYKQGPDLIRTAVAGLTRTAAHTDGGRVTLRQLVPHATRHLTHHVRFIRRALGLAVS